MKVKEILAENKNWGVKHTGQNTNKSIAQLKKERASAKKRGDTTAVRQKDFAIRAKHKGGKKWGKVSESEGFKLSDKTGTQLQHELNALLKAGPHPKGSPGHARIQQLEAAIKAKKERKGHIGGVMHDNKKADEEDCQMTVSGMM